MLEAIRMAEVNVKEGVGGPFGAVIVKDGKIIARSGNLVTTTNDPTAHAEVAAIRIACQALNTYDLTGCTVYASCEPCPMCLAAIYWARISNIYYGNTKEDAAAIGFDDDFIYKEFDKEPSQRSLLIEQRMRDEALSAFKMWDSSTLKIEY